MSDSEFEDAIDDARLDRITAGFEQLRELRDGWMNGKGSAPPADVVEFAQHVVTAIVADLDPATELFLYPTPDGGVRAEWEIGPEEFSLEICEPQRAGFSSVRHDSGADAHHDLGGDEFTIAGEVVARLVLPEDEVDA